MPEPFGLGQGHNDGEPFFIHQVCDPAFTKACQSFAESTGLSFYHQFITALTVCVARMARVDHFAIGIASHCAAGTPLNTLPLVRNYREEQSFLDLATETSKKVNVVFTKHARYPYAILVADQRTEHAVDVNHLNMLSLIDYPETPDTCEQAPPEQVSEGLAIHLNYERKAQRGHLSIGFAGDGRTIAPEDAETLYQALVAVLEAAHQHPETPISKLPLVNAADLERLLSFNGGFFPYPENETIQTLFAKQVKAQPQKVAMICQGESYTYAQLNEWSDQIASVLLAENGGIGLDGQFVGVCLACGADLVTGVFGILKAGGAYVPLDPEYPKERLQFMISDAQIQKALVHERYASLLQDVVTIDPSLISKTGPVFDKICITPKFDEFMADYLTCLDEALEVVDITADDRSEALRILAQEQWIVPAGMPYTVGLFEPSDALGVTRLLYAIYGDGYPVDTYYIPEKLAEENRCGNIYSAVARTASGDIIAHVACYRSSPPNPRLYELGLAMTLPAYRGDSAFHRVSLMVAPPNANSKIDGLYGEAVCNHITSQKITYTIGKMLETGLEPALMPARVNEAKDSADGRIGCLLSFRVDQDRHRKLHVPVAYQSELAFLLEGLNLDRELVVSAATMTGSNAEIEVTRFEFSGVARCMITSPGANLPARLAELERELLSDGYVLIQFFVDLGKDRSGEVVDMLRAQGYFLAGLLPIWFGDDGLLMQKNFVDPEFDRLKIYSERGHRVTEMVRRDWERSEKYRG